MKKTVIFVVVVFSITMAVFFVSQKQAIQEQTQANQQLQSTIEELKHKGDEAETELKKAQQQNLEKKEEIESFRKKLEGIFKEKDILQDTINQLLAENKELSHRLTVTKNRKPTFSCKLIQVDEYRNTVALDYGTTKGAKKNDLLRVMLQDRTIDLIITDVRPDFCIAVVQSTHKLPEKLVNDTYLSIYKTNE
jgi:cell shape-determining protein MreC